eukprot:TRINITY_DN825_c0_g2_i1.p1 TRINITY_DN825_c0_g2~~TRINITY_DN825_c0_g2_i1.p1  ORF type:complete len:207 (+),score=42.29 TRINITY_DN825_c0_g2_i1:164-784(+)
MDTKAFEVMIHSQYAFDVCRSEINTYEDCRQTDTPLPRDPAECKPQAKAVLGCYKQSEKMDPICVSPFNDARECLFKADGNLLNCKDFLQHYVTCQRDPADFKNFLEASTAFQRKAKSFEWGINRGHYDKYLQDTEPTRRLAEGKKCKARYSLSISYLGLTRHYKLACAAFLYMSLSQAAFIVMLLPLQNSSLACLRIQELATSLP